MRNLPILNWNECDVQKLSDSWQVVKATHTHTHTIYIQYLYIHTHTHIENDGNQIKLEISYLETGDMVLLYSTKNFVT